MGRDRAALVNSMTGTVVQKQVILLLMYRQKVSNSLMPYHNAYIIHLASSHHIGILSPPIVLRGRMKGRGGKNIQPLTPSLLFHFPLIPVITSLHPPLAPQQHYYSQPTREGGFPSTCDRCF
ncbi:unnamed protein product [Nyctereutes procyonoides]|uniref:(raccoon dog) hypothetical protein n=1 Tax=Nyctereutes procyonoides TaxID=34880 RepID=A0A811Y432_NYCPR|nr:unnamed protein product [Nyctereutes procyonoides]